MKIYFYVLLMVFFMISCKGETMPVSVTTFKGIKDFPTSTWEGLAKKRILFGHQSVGDNIIMGMTDLIKDNPSIRLSIKQISSPDDLAPGTFVHFPVGENEKAPSKIKDFATKIQQGLGSKVDIALFKFCFVDIDSNTDVERLFQEYRDSMASMKKNYPAVTFVHVTVPLLRKERTTIKGLIDRIVGRPGGFFGDSHNIKRNEYNDLIRKLYSGNEPIFDLAAVESTHPNGTLETFNSGGKRYYALAPEYTGDGGHLNALGRKVVAEQFLLFLAVL
jgi:hypothetical protein